MKRSTVICASYIVTVLNITPHSIAVTYQWSLEPYPVVYGVSWHITLVVQSNPTVWTIELILFQ